MLFIGCHLSTPGGFAATVATAEVLGANTFAYFTRTPRGSRARAEYLPDCRTAMENMHALPLG